MTKTPSLRSIADFLDEAYIRPAEKKVSKTLEKLDKNNREKMAMLKDKLIEEYILHILTDKDFREKIFDEHGSIYVDLWFDSGEPNTQIVLVVLPCCLIHRTTCRQRILSVARPSRDFRHSVPLLPAFRKSWVSL